MTTKWRSVNYIEICSGPGRCIDRATGKEFNGTPLAILKTTGVVGYTNLLFIDYSIEVVESLRKRVSSSTDISDEIKKKVHVLQGDYNNPKDLILTINEIIENSSLNIVFIDPTDISVPWETIKKLSLMKGKVDFIINEAIFTDFNRNSMIPYNTTDSRVASKWENALGIPGFFNSYEYIELAKTRNYQAVRWLFHNKYIDQFKKLGFEYCSETMVGDYYYLVYASKKDIGLRFWKQACLKDGYGQGELDFG